jgi:hypothetical protein
MGQNLPDRRAWDCQLRTDAIDAAHPNYGHILDTPKPGWSGADLLGPLGDTCARNSATTSAKLLLAV